MRAVLFVLAFVVCVLGLAPAVLVDAALREASDGRLRLAGAQGSVWSGRGRLAALAEGDAAAPWAELAWRFEPFSPGWAVSLDGRLAARLRFGLGEMSIEGVEVDAPLGPLLAAVTHPVARSGWSGRLRAQGPGVVCDREGCRGGMELTLDALRTAILPGGPLGRYRAVAAATAEGFAVRVSSNADNRLRVNGRFERNADGVGSAGFDLAGDAELMRVLPGLLHGVSRQTPNGGLRIEWSGR